MQEMVIIAPYFMHRDILDSYRGGDVFSHVKVVSKEELMSSYFGKSRKDAIPFIMKKMNVNYATAKEILRYAPFAKKGINEKIDRLFSLKEELLSKNLLVINKYVEYLFKTADVKVMGYSKHDKELSLLLNCLNVGPQYLINNNIPKLDVTEFKNGEDEIFFTLNKIAELIDNGVNVDDIFIVCQNEEYLPYLRNYSKNFGFNLNIKSNTNWYSQEISLQILKMYAEIRDISLVIDNFSANYSAGQFDKLFKLFLDNRYNDFSYEEQYQYYVALLKNTKLESSYYKGAINVTPDLINKEHAHIFVVGFVQGVYPSFKKDVDYLTNTDKEKLGLNTTFDETDISFDLIKDFLSRNNSYYLSYSLTFGCNSYHKSPLVTSLEMRECKEYIPNIIYSKQYCDFMFSKHLDLASIYYEKTVDYFALKDIADFPGEYHNEFTPVDVNNESKQMKYSYSRIKKYYQCPFAYYLENELKVEEDIDERFYLDLGNLAHHVFEHSFDSDFDFEERYQEFFDRCNFSPMRKVIMEGLKEQIREAVNAYMLHYNQFMKEPKAYTELNVNYYLDNKTVINGKIDKAICLENNYIILVDYKTNKEAFNPKLLEYGVSLQLPTYMFLCDEQPLLKDKQVVGIYINNVIDSSISTVKKAEDELIPSYLRLNGRTIDDLDILTKIDNTFNGESVSFLSGFKYTKGKKLFSGAFASAEEFESYKSIALDCYKRADKKIRQNKFEIAPVFVDKEDPCKYCNFRDICFVKPEQKVYPTGKTEIAEEE